MAEQYKDTSSVLKHHVERAVGLITTLKTRNAKLENEAQQLREDNKKNLGTIAQYENVISQYEDQVKSYAEKMTTLEELLNDAESEQSLLEQSILSAITNLGTIDGGEYLAPEGHKREETLSDDNDDTLLEESAVQLQHDETIESLDISVENKNSEETETAERESANSDDHSVDIEIDYDGTSEEEDSQLEIF